MYRGLYIYYEVRTYSWLCDGRALGNNPGPVAGSGSLTDAPMPLSCANKRWHFPLGCEGKGKLKGDHHQRSGLLMEADGSCSWTRQRTGANSPLAMRWIPASRRRKAGWLWYAPADRHRTLPSAAKMVASFSAAQEVQGMRSRSW